MPCLKTAKRNRGDKCSQHILLNPIYPNRLSSRHTAPGRLVNDTSYILVLSLGNPVWMYSLYISIQTLPLHKKDLLFISISGNFSLKSRCKGPSSSKHLPEFPTAPSSISSKMSMSGEQTRCENEITAQAPLAAFQGPGGHVWPPDGTARALPTGTGSSADKTRPSPPVLWAGTH